MIDWDKCEDFDRPVRLKTKEGTAAVSTVREAAEMLLYHWPAVQTGTHIQARMACMKVLGGSEKTDFARAAFAKAAEEARILLR